MEILLDNYSGVPIYEQIFTQIKEQILDGRVITTKRAYEELEQEGFLYKIAGKGCYVAKRNEALVRENYLREIEKNMDQIQKLASSAGLNKEEILEMWNTMWEDEA